MGLSGRARPDRRWSDAIAGLKSYLPPALTRWVVAFEPRYHSRIAVEVSRTLPVVAELRIGIDPPERIAAAADEYRANPDCGFLEFAVTDAWELDPATVAALMRFASWPEERVRLCFDVADDNFESLFVETPHELGGRAAAVGRRLAGAVRLQLRSGGDAVAEFACASGWTAHVGLEPNDYLLPTGEIECAPLDAAGTIDIGGWIVGTLPFGGKYGRLSPGMLRLSLQGGRICGAGGANRELVRDFELALHRIPDLDAIAELGIGLSRAVTAAARTTPVGCLWHERHYGVHVGIGATLAPDGRQTGHHLDLVLAHGTLELPDGSPLLAW